MMGFVLFWSWPNSQNNKRLIRETKKFIETESFLFFKQGII